MNFWVIVFKTKLYRLVFKIGLLIPFIQVYYLMKFIHIDNALYIM